VPKGKLVGAVAVGLCALGTWRGEGVIDEVQVVQKVPRVVEERVERREDVVESVESDVCVETGQVNEEIVCDRGLSSE